MGASDLRGAPPAGIPLGCLGDLAARTRGQLLGGDPAAQLAGAAADTRAVRPGDLFCAIRGERVDAHRLIPAAFAAGAAAVLVDRRPGDGWSLADVPPGAGALWVPDVIPALGRLAAAHLRSLVPAPLVVGVTGSVGKTGTRGLVAAALGGGGAPVLTPQRSFNTEVTVPLVCLRAGGQPFIALELAMRGPGQIAYLCRMCSPRIGVLTVIGQSHMESLGSQEAIVQAKGELLAALPADGWAVMNADDPRQRAMAARSRAPVCWYGLDRPADVRAEGVRPGEGGGYRFTAVLPGGRRIAVDLPVIGRHHVGNALAALAVADLAGVSPEAAAAGLRRMQPEAHRMAWRRSGRVRVLDDAYNAAPQSVVAALASLVELAADGPRAAVLGDMFELGSAAEGAHREVGEAAARAGLRWLITVGPLAEIIARTAVQRGMDASRVVSVADRMAAEAVVPALLEGSPDGIAVLVKGSRALGLEGLVTVIEAWGRPGAD